MKVGVLSGARWVFFGQDIFLVYGTFVMFNLLTLITYSPHYSP